MTSSGLMRMLVAGRPGSGQSQVVQEITGQVLPEDSTEGAIVDHTFKNKYFTQDCGIYVDAFTSDNVSDWVKEFSSEEALQLREIMVAFVYTFDSTVDPEIAQFLAKLKDEDWSGQALAVPKNGVDSVSEADIDDLERWGFDLIDRTEIVDVAQTAILDFGGELEHDLENATERQQKLRDQDISSEANDMTEPLMPEDANLQDMDDLSGIMAQLRQARDSQMTSDQKMELARKLAEKLVP